MVCSWELLIFLCLVNALKLIVLDRDGVINEDSDAYIKSLDEWIPIPGALEAMAQLYQAGWHIAVATNQSGLARGLFDRATLEAIHARLQQLLAQQGATIDLICYCPHGPEDHCDCRKPQPGLFRQIAQHFGRMDLQNVPVVGDSLRDLQAGIALGATPYLVKTGKGLHTLNGELPQGTRVFEDLPAVAHYLLRVAS